MQEFLRIGTCSWKYDSWIGLIYTEAGRHNYLQEYSQHYSTVEIDQWFWSLFDGKKPVLPNPKTVQEYVDAVPDHFEFTVKVPNSITLTHYYQSANGHSLQANPYFLSNDLFEAFLASLAPMHQQIGQLMFQFEYLNKQKMADQLLFMQRFGDFIANCPAGFPYAIEIRNPHYLNEKYFAYLQSKNLAHVFLQGYYMPSIVSVFSQHKSHIEKNAIIRLHGPNRKQMEEMTGNQWSEIVAPRDAELSEIARMVLEMIEKKIKIFFNVNNHYEGSAPKTIARFEALLQKANAQDRKG